jgi:hypothetical protein
LKIQKRQKKVTLAYWFSRFIFSGENGMNFLQLLVIANCFQCSVKSKLSYNLDVLPSILLNASRPASEVNTYADDNLKSLITALQQRRKTR